MRCMAGRDSRMVLFEHKCERIVSCKASITIMQLIRCLAGDLHHDAV